MSKFSKPLEPCSGSKLIGSTLCILTPQWKSGWALKENISNILHPISQLLISLMVYCGACHILITESAAQLRSSETELRAPGPTAMFESSNSDNSTSGGNSPSDGDSPSGGNSPSGGSSPSEANSPSSGNSPSGDSTYRAYWLGGSVQYKNDGKLSYTWNDGTTGYVVKQDAWADGYNTPTPWTGIVNTFINNEGKIGLNSGNDKANFICQYDVPTSVSDNLIHTGIFGGRKRSLF